MPGKVADHKSPGNLLGGHCKCLVRLDKLGPTASGLIIHVVTSGTLIDPNQFGDVRTGYLEPGRSFHL